MRDFFKKLALFKKVAGFKTFAGAARLMVGIPDYDSYVAHCRAVHPDQPAMSFEAFFRDRQNARYACDKGRFRGCC